MEALDIECLQGSTEHFEKRATSYYPLTQYFMTFDSFYMLPWIVLQP
jgi:hypothetical protein